MANFITLKEPLYFANQNLKWYKHLQHTIRFANKKKKVKWAPQALWDEEEPPGHSSNQLVGYHRAERGLADGIWEKWVALATGPTAAGTGCVPTRGLCQHS